jgi:hypothetical protein
VLRPAGEAVAATLVKPEPSPMSAEAERVPEMLVEPDIVTLPDIADRTAAESMYAHENSAISQSILSL